MLYQKKTDFSWPRYFLIGSPSPESKPCWWSKSFLFALIHHAALWNSISQSPGWSEKGMRNFLCRFVLILLHFILIVRRVLLAQCCLFLAEEIPIPQVILFSTSIEFRLVIGQPISGLEIRCFEFIDTAEVQIILLFEYLLNKKTQWIKSPIDRSVTAVMRDFISFFL